MKQRHPPGSEVARAIQTVCLELAAVYHKEGLKKAANIAEGVADIVKNEGWKPSKARPTHDPNASV